MALKGEKVFLTGITGFMGSHLARRLLHEGAQVSALVREDSNSFRIQDIRDEIDLRSGDLRDLDGLTSILHGIKPKKVFHLAAYTNVERGMEHLYEVIMSNIGGTLNLLKALEGTDYHCLINTGTCEEYGDNPVPFSEEQPFNPVSPYSASKASTTLFCQMFHKTMGLPVVTLRPFLSYGPFQDPNRLIPQVIICALEHKEFKMSPGEQTREFNYITDIVDGYIKAAITPQALGHVINIGNGMEHRIRDVVEKILRLMGNPIEPKVGAFPYRPGETMHFFCSNSRARTLLNWQPRVSLDEGLRLTIAWYKKHYLTRKGAESEGIRGEDTGEEGRSERMAHKGLDERASP